MNPQDNERLIRVGPGTLMGTLLRHYWMPALLEEEVAEPDGSPVRLRLLGEDLVAFHDTRGRVGIIEAHCAHRRAHLFYGRNEECGLRCIYHGWKYDVDGTASTFLSSPRAASCSSPRQKRVAYRTAVRGGVVGLHGRATFLPSRTSSGRRCRPATDAPRSRCTGPPSTDRLIRRMPRFYTAAPSLLPDASRCRASGPTTVIRYSRSRRLRPDCSSVPAGASMMTQRYFGALQFLMPFHQMFSPVTDADLSACNYSGHSFVPIDDENIWLWSFSANPIPGIQRRGTRLAQARWY